MQGISEKFSDFSQYYYYLVAIVYFMMGKQDNALKMLDKTCINDRGCCGISS